MEKSNTYKFLSVLYIIFNIVFPSVIMLLSLFNKDITNENNSVSGIVRINFLFVTLPIYLVYASIIFKNIINTSLTRILLAFFPTVLTIFFIIFNFKKSYFFPQLLLDSLPVFLGIYFMLIFGLMALIIKKSKENKKQLFLKITVALIIILVVAFPVFYFLKIGLGLSVILSSSNHILNILKFIFSIFLVIIFHYKLIIDLYKKGEF